MLINSAELERYLSRDQRETFYTENMTAEEYTGILENIDILKNRLGASNS